MQCGQKGISPDVAHVVHVYGEPESATHQLPPKALQTMTLEGRLTTGGSEPGEVCQYIYRSLYPGSISVAGSSATSWALGPDMDRPTRDATLVALRLPLFLSLMRTALASSILLTLSLTRRKESPQQRTSSVQLQHWLSWNRARPLFHQKTPLCGAGAENLLKLWKAKITVALPNLQDPSP